MSVVTNEVSFFFTGLCWHSFQPTVHIASLNQPAIPSDGDGSHVATRRAEKGILT